jgi:uncharacterized protein (TIGR00369 family)
MTAPLVTREEFLGLVHATMPEIHGLDVTMPEYGFGTATVRLGFDPRKVRPGGTLSGPTVMTLADLALYAITLSVVGFQPLAVTTDLTIHFLRKPKPMALVCKAQVVKAGKRLVIGTAFVFSEGEDDPVAHVVGTYSVPPREG